MLLSDFSVNMVGYSYMDLMTAVVGTFFYQIVWNALSATGLILLPFAITALNTLKETVEGDGLTDEPLQHFSRTWVSFVIMFGVLVFCAVPSMKVTGLDIRMQLRECDKSAAEIANAQTDPANNMLLGTTGALVVSGLKKALMIYENYEYANEKDALDNFNAQITFSGEVLRVPVWWYFWRQVSMAVSAYITAEIPCDNGLRALKNQLNTKFIEDKSLAEDFGKFMAQCTMPAKALLQKKYIEKNLEEMAFLPTYDVYNAQNDYYGVLRSKLPVWGFGVESSERGYDATRAPDSSLPATQTGYGYPMCDKWWDDESVIDREPAPNEAAGQKTYRGMKRRLFEYYGITDDDLCGSWLSLFGWKFGTNSPTCQVEGVSENDVLASILKEQLLSQSEGSLKAMSVLSKHLGDAGYMGSHSSTEEGSKLAESIFGATFDLGVLSSSYADFSGNFALLKTMPLATSFLIMMVTALLPLAMIVSMYKPEALLGLTLSYCSFLLWIPYFRMVRWLDDHLVSLVAVGYQANAQMMLEMMIAITYVAVPLLMSTLFTVAGVRVAQLDPIGANHMGSIANNAAKNVENKISKMVGDLKKGQ